VSFQRKLNDKLGMWLNLIDLARRGCVQELWSEVQRAPLVTAALCCVEVVCFPPIAAMSVRFGLLPLECLLLWVKFIRNTCLYPDNRRSSAPV
jgi:hypothetical protein